MSALVLGAAIKIGDIQSHSFNPGCRNLQVVQVESDSGYDGCGESGLCSWDLLVGGAVSHFWDFLIGQDPRHLPATLRNPKSTTQSPPTHP